MPLTFNNMLASWRVSTLVFIVSPAWMGRAPEGPASRSALFGAVTRFDLLLGGVAFAVFLHERVDKLAIGLIPVGDNLELGTIPLDDAGPVVTHVVLAGGTHRAQNLGKAEFLQTFLSQVEVLETPAHLVRRHVLALAELFLGRADGLHLQHGDDHPARMGNGTHRGAIGAGALTLVIDVLPQVFMHTAFVC